MIVASFAAAYGLRIRNPGTEIPWPEFLDLLSNLPGDMPLPMMIGIRLSTDKELEYMSDAAKTARDNWYLWLAEEESVETHRDPVDGLEQMFESIFGGGKRG